MTGWSVVLGTYGTALGLLDGALAMRSDIRSSLNYGLQMMIIPAGKCCAWDDVAERGEEAAV